MSVTAERLLVVSAVVQSLAVTGYLYVTYRLLRETARSARVVALDQAARFAPHLVLDATLEIAFAAGSTILFRVSNRGTGAAIGVQLSGVRGARLKVAATDSILTASGAVIIVPSCQECGFRGRGDVAEAGGDVRVRASCEDALGGQWGFEYVVHVPGDGGRLVCRLATLSRPGDLPDRARRVIYDEG